MIEFLMHDDRDNVGVVVVDVKSGKQISGKSLHGKARPKVTALNDIPLGHKVALQNFKPGDTVVKYGEDIGKVAAAIKEGEHVHVHNLKTKRW